MRQTATQRFSELLLVLLKGKTGLIDSLRILAQEGIEKDIRDIASSLLLMMKKGKNLSESLKGIGNGKTFFEPLYLSLIGAAETTGNIEPVLERIVIDLQRKQRTKENALGIMIYPAIIVLLAIAGTAAIIVKAMPVFTSAGLLSAGAASDAKAGIAAAGTVLLSGGSALFIVYRKIFNNDSPEFRIFYILDFLLRSNVTLIEALSHCITSLGRSKYGGALILAKKDISCGTAFSAAFARIKYFSPYIIGWLSIADMHGNLADICCNIKNYYELKDNKLRETASRLIEPAVIVLTGLYISIIILTAVLPILTFAGGIL